MGGPATERGDPSSADYQKARKKISRTRICPTWCLCKWSGCSVVWSISFFSCYR